MKKMKSNRLGSSFRDPNGFLFTKKGVLYRQINHSYKNDYDFLLKSGLYEKLVKDRLLIAHVNAKRVQKEEGAYKMIKPKFIDFISYPYEWCFSQLKDAALLTLKIQKVALSYGMTLKDASAYNVQFVSGRPIFIDTLSFEIYKEGEPWVAYRQFCQHFLAPLALMGYKDYRLGVLLRGHIDGIPLDLASTLLPVKSFTNLSLLIHLHLHAKSQKHYVSGDVTLKKWKVGKNAQIALIGSLESAVRRLDLKANKSVWKKYYQSTNYSIKSFNVKKKLVEKLVRKLKPREVWDLGANNGEFSRIAASYGLSVISFDSDFLCVEDNYRKVRGMEEEDILPLYIDLTNPSPSLGWLGQERESLVGRGPADCVMALALIHHLAIGNNVPFSKIAEFFSDISSRWLIIEYISKNDSNVQRLLRNREDIFFNYSKVEFEKEFKKYFSIQDTIDIQGTKRILYLMKRK